MAESPSVHKDRVLACSVYCNGSKLKDEYALVSAMVHQELNRIGKATLKFNAGNMDKQTFDESDADLFKPGNTIRLDAGDIDKEDTLFDGVIIGLRIITDRNFRSYMLVECRDYAYSATQGRKNRIFEKKKDCDIIKEVLLAYGSVEVDSTPYQHPTLVQYYCSDWDFALSRADANGLFIFTDGSKIKVKKPDVSASPVLTVTYGVDLTAFDLELSADDQFTQYEAMSWDPATQKAVKVSASSPSLNKQGDLQPKNIATGDSFLLQTDAPTDEKALKQWADGMALKAGLARYQGSCSFYGSAKVVPGCIIELKGLGKRFNGNLFVGSVTHTIENNEWMTEAGAGVSSLNITDETDVVSPSASGFLPGLQGLHAAVVRKLDGDPLKNLDAFEKVIRYMKAQGIGYGSINHPVDRDPVCGYNGIIGDTCPKCGRSETDGEYGFQRIRRITGYLVGTLDRFNNAKRAEVRDRVKHSIVTEVKLEAKD